MIAKITDAYVRHYSDNGQTKAYVEWIDNRGKAGRTEGGACHCCGANRAKVTVNGKTVQLGDHMAALPDTASTSASDIWPASSMNSTSAARRRSGRAHSQAVPPSKSYPPAPKSCATRSLSLIA